MGLRIDWPLRETEPRVTTSAERMEVQLLRAKVRRLERALTEVIEASDEVIITLQRSEAELLAKIEQSQSGFEQAWGSFEPEPATTHQLNLLDTDLRARSWLLAR